MIAHKLTVAYPTLRVHHSATRSTHPHTPTHTHTHIQHTQQQHTHTNFNVLCSHTELINKIHKMQSDQSTTSATEKPATNSNNVRQRRTVEQENSDRDHTSGNESTAPSYTSQQQEAVER